MENGNPELKYINAAFVGKQTKGSHLKEITPEKSCHGLKTPALPTDIRLIKRLLHQFLITPVLLILKVFTP